MGSDDLHHKKKARKAASLRRAKAKRSSYDLVLIVCEGSKTEPNYFHELKDAFRLNNANIKICGKECGSDPLSVVVYAIGTYKTDPVFDRVYCVFDRDRHTSYAAALDKASRTRLRKVSKIIPVPSVPCFEFWLLLHYVYTTRPFAAAGKKSICDQVIRELRKYLPDYEKGQKGTFTQTRAMLDTAMKHARQVERHNRTSGTDNPSTQLHVLVEYLRDLKIAH